MKSSAGASATIIDIRTRAAAETTPDPAAQPAILVVEDDPALLSILSYNLIREGYRVLRAPDGDTGLALAQRESDGLNLIILDRMLPGIDGLHLLHQVRTRSDVPVLILSARGEERDKIDGLEMGADDYVVKPFALGELLARVRAMVRRGQVPTARPPSVIRRGPLRIEPDRHRAFVGSERLQLRPKEFGLLTTLAWEPEKVFSRQRLLDEIWGEDVIVDPRTVDVHVSWLRAKLIQYDLPSDTIRTVHGVGYCFTEPSDGIVAPPSTQRPIAGDGLSPVRLGMPDEGRPAPIRELKGGTNE